MSERYDWQMLQRNGAEPLTVLVCVECGVLVQDETIHDLFHARDGRSLVHPEVPTVTMQDVGTVVQTYPQATIDPPV